MKTQDIMTRDPATCMADTSLEDVARMMWDCDCGFLPVLDQAGKLCGVVTDRDACMAALMTGRRLSNLRARDAMATDVQTCRPKDELDKVQSAMRKRQVRRLVVVDDSAKPGGVVSLNDLALHALNGRPEDAREVATTLGEICQHRSAIQIPMR